MKVGKSLELIREHGLKIDLFPSGKAGVEAKVFLNPITETAWVLVYGTDSAFDWILHFLPGWGDWIEISYAVALGYRIRKMIKEAGIKRLYLYGHSWGGAIAAIVHEELLEACPDLEISTTGLGYKKPIAGMLNLSYRNRGDIVPLLTPWRRGRLYGKRLFGRWKPFWIAHRLSEYIQNLKDVDEVDLTEEA